MKRLLIVFALTAAIVVTAFIAGLRFAAAEARDGSAADDPPAEETEPTRPSRRVTRPREKMSRPAPTRESPQPVAAAQEMPVPRGEEMAAPESADRPPPLVRDHADERISYPAPMFVGSPTFDRPVRNPHSAPWVISLPAGAVNVALHKPVTSSDSEPLLGTLSMVTDGAKSCIEGDQVELSAGAQWVQVDLQRPCRVDGFALWHHCASPVSYHAVQVWLSNDAEFRTGVLLFNNDRKNLLGRGAGQDEEYLETNLGLVWSLPRPLAGRYVRAYSRGNTANGLNHYIELEVYGLSF